jgi:hypothetical protein
MMKRSLFALLVALPLLWPAAGSAAEGGPPTREVDLIGLWEGVDPADGSLTQRSITCDAGGACRVLGSDQFFSFCENSGGRGLLAGTGSIENGALAVPDFSLTCADGSATPEFFTRFSLDRRNGTLVEDTDGPPPTITFHRLSAPVRGGR